MLPSQSALVLTSWKDSRISIGFIYFFSFRPLSLLSFCFSGQCQYVVWRDLICGVHRLVVFLCGVVCHSALVAGGFLKDDGANSSFFGGANLPAFSFITISCLLHLFIFFLSFLFILIFLCHAVNFEIMVDVSNENVPQLGMRLVLRP